MEETTPWVVWAVFAAALLMWPFAESLYVMWRDRRHAAARLHALRERLPVLLATLNSQGTTGRVERSLQLGVPPTDAAHPGAGTEGCYVPGTITACDCRGSNDRRFA